jgi:heme/copper-type cytochrome/quinol oxidase subunit 2
MDEVLVRQLVRQLKIINLWITLFGTVIVVALIVLGILVFKVVTFVHSTEQKVSDLQQKTVNTLNVKDDICKSSVLSGSGYCKE